MAFFTKRYHPPGTSPGTLVEERADEDPPLRIRLIDYDVDQLSIREEVSPETCALSLEEIGNTWVHVEGRPSGDELRDLGAAFELHPLIMEDVHNTGQRPKIETYDGQLFLIMALPLMRGGTVEVSQVSLILSGDRLISFCETGFESFEPILKRLREKSTRVRAREADYLLYSLLDLVIDQAFPVLEDFGLQLEELEDLILSAPAAETLATIHTIKREMILLRRMLWPQRDVINQLLRDEHEWVREETLIYLRDCYDHTVQIMDLLETYRDMSASMLEIYLSSVSNRMNETMRVLTVIATVFMPLTFVAGVYGMNFDRTASQWNMPELGWPYGYVMTCGVMVAIALGMIAFFRRRGWF